MNLLKSLGTYCNDLCMAVPRFDSTVGSYGYEDWTGRYSSPH